MTLMLTSGSMSSYCLIGMAMAHFEHLVIRTVHNALRGGGVLVTYSECAH